MSKVNIGQLINKMVDDVNEVERSDRDQGYKTKRYKAIANSFKTTLFTDKRKYRGEGVKRRITANTFNAYISRARKRFDDRFHHHFNKNVQRLVERYPIYAAELREWLNLPTSDVRRRLSALQSQLKAIMPLAEELSDVNFGAKGSEKKLHRLSKKYPDWQLTLTELTGPDWKSARDEMYAAFRQGGSLLDELNHLKVNHEILYHLQLTSAERASIQQRWAAVLGEKKRSTVMIDYQKYMQAVHDILNTPINRFDLGTRIGMAPLAFALAAVSGRRMIEIMWLGEFTAKGKYSVEFTGQAKKRSESHSTPRTIYTLCDASLFVERLNVLRGCRAASDFDEVIQGTDQYDTRSENGRLNAILAKAFNPWVKDFFNDDRRVFKDSRSIYARIAYEMWFRHDPRWNNVDEDVFFSEILGHDDENTQLHYKQFKLKNFSRTWRPTVGEKNTRLANLQALDDQMADFARGDAGIRIHNTVKGIVESDPTAKITNSTLRAYGFNSPLIRRYLAFAADALCQFVGENGQYQLRDDTPPIIVQDVDGGDDDNGDDDDQSVDDGDDSLEDDEIDIDDNESDDADNAVSKNESAVDDRPRFSAPKRAEDGAWIIEFLYCGSKYYWSGHADNLGAAMKAAWDNYF